MYIQGGGVPDTQKKPVYGPAALSHHWLNAQRQMTVADYLRNQRLGPRPTAFDYARHIICLCCDTI